MEVEAPRSTGAAAPKRACAAAGCTDAFEELLRAGEVARAAPPAAPGFRTRDPRRLRRALQSIAGADAPDENADAGNEGSEERGEGADEARGCPARAKIMEAAIRSALDDRGQLLAAMRPLEVTDSRAPDRGDSLLRVLLSCEELQGGLAAWLLARVEAGVEGSSEGGDGARAIPEAGGGARPPAGPLRGEDALLALGQLRWLPKVAPANRGGGQGADAPGGVGGNPSPATPSIAASLVALASAATGSDPDVATAALQLLPEWCPRGRSAAWALEKAPRPAQADPRLLGAWLEAAEDLAAGDHAARAEAAARALHLAPGLPPACFQECLSFALRGDVGAGAAGGGPPIGAAGEGGEGDGPTTGAGGVGAATRSGGVAGERAKPGARLAAAVVAPVLEAAQAALLLALSEAEAASADKVDGGARGGGSGEADGVGAGDDGGEAGRGATAAVEHLAAAATAAFRHALGASPALVEATLAHLRSRLEGESGARRRSGVTPARATVSPLPALPAAPPAPPTAPEFWLLCVAAAVGNAKSARLAEKILKAAVAAEGADGARPAAASSPTPFEEPLADASLAWPAAALLVGGGRALSPEADRLTVLALTLLRDRGRRARLAGELFLAAMARSGGSEVRAAASTAFVDLLPSAAGVSGGGAPRGRPSPGFGRPSGRDEGLACAPLRALLLVAAEPGREAAPPTRAGPLDPTLLDGAHPIGPALYAPPRELDLDALSPALAGALRVEAVAPPPLRSATVLHLAADLLAALSLRECERGAPGPGACSAHDPGASEEIVDPSPLDDGSEAGGGDGRASPPDDLGTWPGPPSTASPTRVLQDLVAATYREPSADAVAAGAATLVAVALALARRARRRSGGDPGDPQLSKWAFDSLAEALTSAKAHPEVAAATLEELAARLPEFPDDLEETHDAARDRAAGTPSAHPDAPSAQPISARRFLSPLRDSVLELLETIFVVDLEDGQVVGSAGAAALADGSTLRGELWWTLDGADGLVAVDILPSIAGASEEISRDAGSRSRAGPARAAVAAATAVAAGPTESRSSRAPRAPSSAPLYPALALACLLCRRIDGGVGEIDGLLGAPWQSAPAALTPSDPGAARAVAAGNRPAALAAARLGVVEGGRWCKALLTAFAPDAESASGPGSMPRDALTAKLLRRIGHGRALAAMDAAWRPGEGPATDVPAVAPAGDASGAAASAAAPTATPPTADDTLTVVTVATGVFGESRRRGRPASGARAASPHPPPPRFGPPLSVATLAILLRLLDERVASELARGATSRPSPGLAVPLEGEGSGTLPEPDPVGPPPSAEADALLLDAAWLTRELTVAVAPRSRVPAASLAAALLPLGRLLSVAARGPLGPGAAALLPDGVRALSSACNAAAVTVAVGGAAVDRALACLDAAGGCGAVGRDRASDFDLSARLGAAAARASRRFLALCPGGLWPEGGSVAELSPLSDPPPIHRSRRSQPCAEYEAAAVEASLTLERAAAKAAAALFARRDAATASGDPAAPAQSPGDTAAAAPAPEDPWAAVRGRRALLARELLARGGGGGAPAHARAASQLASASQGATPCDGGAAGDEEGRGRAEAAPETRPTVRPPPLLASLLTAALARQPGSLGELETLARCALPVVGTATSGPAAWAAVEGAPALCGGTLSEWYRAAWEALVDEWAAAVAAAAAVSEQESGAGAGEGAGGVSRVQDTTLTLEAAAGTFSALTAVVRRQPTRASVHAAALRYGTAFLDAFCADTRGFSRLLEADPAALVALVARLQKGTKILQRLCAETKVQRNMGAAARVPAAKRAMERFICSVRSVLASQGSLGGFRLGTLPHKDLSGIPVPSQAFPIDDAGEEEAGGDEEAGCDEEGGGSDRADAGGRASREEEEDLPIVGDGVGADEDDEEEGRGGGGTDPGEVDGLEDGDEIDEADESESAPSDDE